MKILVFRIGQLGDTVVALPAMWAVRRHYPKATLTLLSDRHPRRNLVSAASLLAGAGIFDEFLSYPVERELGGKLMRLPRMMSLLLALRRQAFDLLIYLAPSLRTPGQVARDRRFFSAAGIKQILGTRLFPQFPARIPGKPLPVLPLESDLLLARLAADGIPTPPDGKGCFDLNLGPAEEHEVNSWLDKLPSDGRRPWIGIGPGSKMPAKRWNAERFAQAGSALVERHAVWPVVFGGPEDRELGGALLSQWGCGHNAAGSLALRASADRAEAMQALSRQRHRHDAPGRSRWSFVRGGFLVTRLSWTMVPAGRANHVFRSQIECEGCGLTECLERHNECLNRISPDEVLAGCEAALAGNHGSPASHRAVPLSQPN